MAFIKQPNVSFGRTLYQADQHFFLTMLNRDIPKDGIVIDQRLMVMTAIGLLNRTLNLEDYLIAVVGQKWRFNRLIKVGETLSVSYEIHENSNNKRFIYDINIDLMASNEVVAEGVWTILLNQKL